MMPRSSPPIRSSSALAAVLGAFLVACSSGSSGGGGGGQPVLDEVEPNDLFDDAEVVELIPGRAGNGELETEADVDFWSMDLTEGEVVQIELFATRLDHNSWDTADSIPRITIYAPDGATVLVNHDYTTLWSWGKHDLDHPMLRVPETGLYYASITCDGLAVTDGDYCIRLNRLNVGALQVEDGESLLGNDDHLTAQAIVPGTVYGFHDDDDTDYYSFDVTSPSVVRFELVSYRNGVIDGDDDYYDTELNLYDQDGISTLFNDDDSFFYDSGIQFLIDTPGTYFIEVTECCGSGDAPYFLTFSRSAAAGAVENEPNEDPETADAIAYGGSIRGHLEIGSLDGFRFQGTRGDMVRVQVFDIGNSQSKLGGVFAVIYGPDAITTLPTGGDEEFQTLTTILTETGPHYIVVEDEGVETDYRVELTRFKQATWESEPNDVIAQADPLQTRAAGVIDLPPPVGGGGSDVDLFRFSVSANRLTTISIYAGNGITDSDGISEFSGHGSDLSPTLRILDADGNEVETAPGDWLAVATESVTNALPCGAVSFVDPEGGTFYVEVTDAFAGFGSDYYYVIEKTN